MVTYDTLSIIQPPFSLTNEDARSMCRANKTPVRDTVAKSQQGECVTWNYRAAKITKRDGMKRKSVRVVWGSCQLQGCAQMEVCDGEKKEHHIGSAGVRAHAKSTYLLTQAITPHNVKVYMCLLPGVSCPDETYSKVMVLGVRCGSVISQTYSPGNL